MAAAMTGDFDTVLVLGGGNALGAFQGGAYEGMEAAGLRPDWVLGASIGAMNGAIVAGNPPERRVERLRAFWEMGAIPGAGWPVAEEMRRTGAVIASLASGAGGRFVPRLPLWWDAFGGEAPPSLYDHAPLAATLERLVDPDRLNDGHPRFTATAVDVESGEEVAFDTGAMRVTAQHLRASGALLPVFPAVEIGGRLHADAGLSANLPLDLAFNEAGGGEAGERPMLCIAVDLLPLAGRRPRTMGETVERMQDLIFAAQSRRAIAAWQALFDARAAAGDARSVTLLYLPYADQADEVSGKAFDFSAATIAARWRAGRTAMARALADGVRPTGEAGLTVWTPAPSGGLERVRWSLVPSMASGASAGPRSRSCAPPR